MKLQGEARMIAWLRCRIPLRLLRAWVWDMKKCVLLSGVFFLALGCRSADELHGPSIVFVHVPPSEAGGPELLDHFSGRVIDGPTGTRIVAFAENGDWWVQPFRSRSFTDVGADGSWETATHLGKKYAVLLVSSGYTPPERTADLPAVGGKVLAVAVTQGSPGRLAPPRVIHFSGYDWRVSSTVDYRGGDMNEYEPSNAWVDDHGYLHLLMGQEEGHWHCAGINLTRSLGYGTYRFVVQDSSHLPASAVLAIFTHDDRQDQEDAAEMDIELSQWGKAQNRNADYVVQPYYVPENTVHFNVPGGPVTYVMRWEPGSVRFRTFSGTSAQSDGRKIMDHVFKSGVPVPATETVHLDLFDFHHSKSGLQHPVEIVAEKFEYLP